MFTLGTSSLVQKRKHWQGTRKLAQIYKPCYRVKGRVHSPGPVAARGLPRTASGGTAPIATSYFGTVFATLHFWGS